MSEPREGVREDRPEREGLPPNFRMRADSHYVEQLDSRREPPAVRLIPAQHIDALAAPTASGVTALTQSIAVHGLLQPLLVRKLNGRYQLIAGRKRLAAARAVGIGEVPCIVRDVDEVGAAALAEADNLRLRDDPHKDPVPPPSDADCVPDLLRALRLNLGSINALGMLVKASTSDRFQLRVSTDLLVAQAWRAEYLVGTAAVITTPYCPGRVLPLTTLIERLSSGFEAEARLKSFKLECRVTPDATQIAFDENLVVALAGAVLAKLSWLEGFDQPRVEIRVDAPNRRALNIEIVQRIAPMPAVADLSSPSVCSSASLPTAIGLLAVRALATHYRGTVKLTSIGSRGSLIRAVFEASDGDELEREAASAVQR